MKASHVSRTAVLILLTAQALETVALISITTAYRSPLFSTALSESNLHDESTSFEDAVLNRRSCKRFRRFDGGESSTDAPNAFRSDPYVVQQALRCLDLARRTPTAFNTQPYKVVLVHSPEQKLALSRYCLGPNGVRVRDSDCTAVFLADRQVFRTFHRYREFLAATAAGRKPLSRKALLSMQFYITLFSSGYPLPRFLAATISFGVRTAVAMINAVTSAFYPLPSLANAETWSSKQVMMVAMTYMLGCTSLGLATAPMEGKVLDGRRQSFQLLSIESNITLTSLLVRHQCKRHTKSNQRSK